MELKDYLKTLSQEQRARLAKTVGTSAAYLIQLAGNHRSASPDLAKKLEAATGGLVTRQELRPDIYEGMAPADAHPRTSRKRAS